MKDLVDKHALALCLKCLTNKNSGTVVSESLPLRVALIEAKNRIGGGPEKPLINMALLYGWCGKTQVHLNNCQVVLKEQTVKAQRCDS